MKTKAIIILLSLTIITLVYVKIKTSNKSEPIPSAGGKSLEIQPNENTAYYLQGDPKWANEKLGGSGESFAATGCLICSIAMAGSTLNYDITPAELNERMKKNGGFTNQGWVIWTKIPAATDEKLSVKTYEAFTHADIDKALGNNFVPVIKYYIFGRIPHWVPIVGKSGLNYLIKDPLDSQKRIFNLSTRTQKIESLRVIQTPS